MQDVAISVDPVDHRRAGTALVQRDLAGIAVSLSPSRLIEEAPCRSHVALARQQEVDGPPFLSTWRPPRFSNATESIFPAEICLQDKTKSTENSKSDL